MASYLLEQLTSFLVFSYHHQAVLQLWTNVHLPFCLDKPFPFSCPPWQERDKDRDYELRLQFTEFTESKAQSKKEHVITAAIFMTKV